MFKAKYLYFKNIYRTAQKKRGGINIFRRKAFNKIELTNHLKKLTQW